MAILALTMGPHLGIIMVPTVLSVGSAGTITFKAVGANGNVRWKLISSNLPDEWDASLNVSGGQATLETDEIEVPGTFTVTVQCTDESRVPVVRTFAVRLMALPLTITGSLPDWTQGVAVTGSLTISGGVPPYSGLLVISGAFPAGVTASIVGSSIVPSGTPTADGAWSATLQVSDSNSVPAQISVGGDVASGGHTRYRVLVTASHDGTGPAFSTVQFRDGSGNNLSTGGTASASSVYTPGPYGASNAFDGDPSTLWGAGGDPPQWIAYQTSAPVYPVKVLIQHRDDMFWEYGQIKDIQIQSSDDGVSWTTEWSVAGISPMTQGEIRIFNRP